MAEHLLMVVECAWGADFLAGCCFIGLAIMLVMLLESTRQPYQEIAFTDFETLLTQGRVSEFTIDDYEVRGQVKDGTTIPGAATVRNISARNIPPVHSPTAAI